MIAPRRQAVGSLVATLVAVTAVACTGGHGSVVPPPVVGTTDAPTTFPDRSSDSLAAVGGVTTVVVRLTPGKATIKGQVVDDTGATVGGAIVHLERVVGGQSAGADIAATADGSYVATGIVGGLYRVRAWRLPDLALLKPQVVFLGAEETATANLALQRFTGLKVTNSVAPDPPIIDQPANLVVEVATSDVGTDGVVRGKGKPGVNVELVGAGRWSVNGATAAITDSSGLVTWQVTCTELGPQPLSVVVDGAQSYPLALGPCSPVPPTTTTPPTTGPNAGPTTTATTTQPRSTTAPKRPRIPGQ